VSYGTRRFGPGVVLALAAVALTTLVCTVAYRGLTIDDAFIAFRFAHHARLGRGFVWNLGEPPVEGMTSFLWTALLVPFAYDTHALYSWSKALGVSANLATLALWIKFFLGRFRGRSSSYALWLLAAACPVFTFQSLNGLETAMAVLLASSMLFVVLRMVREPAGPGTGLARDAMLFGLLWLLGGMTRPELVLYGLALMVFGTWEMDGQRRTRVYGCLAASFVLPGTVFFLCRWRYFGHFLPLPFYAKRAEGLIAALGVRYVVLTFVGLAGCASVLALLGFSRRFGTLLSARELRLLVWPSLLLCACYVAFRPIMGFVYRFPAPFLAPLLAAAAGTTAHVLEERGPSLSKRRMVAGLWLLGALQLASAAVPAWHFSHINSQATRAFHQRFGEALADLPEAGRLAAFNDVGGPAFFSDWNTVEGAGLVTPAALFARMSDQDLVRSFRPDVITQSVDESQLESLPTAFPGYELLRAVPWLVFTDVHPQRYQAVFARRDYPYRDELRDRLADMGTPEIPPPWYFGIYRRMKRALG
jgi:hypothetical protein